jgi:hypothetical protein
MTSIQRPCQPPSAVIGEPRSSARDSPPTVATLGIRVRLVPVATASEGDVADLRASCEAVRVECERLVQICDRLLADLDASARGQSPRSSLG